MADSKQIPDSSIQRWNELDIDQFSDAMRRFDLQVNQLSQGRFRASSTLIDLGGIRLMRRKVEASYCSRGVLPDDILFVFPLNEHRLTINGVLVDSTMQITGPGGVEFTNVFPAETEQLLVGLDAKVLSRYLNPEEVQRFVSRVDFMRVFACDQPLRERTVSAVLAMFIELEQLPHPLPAEVVDSASQALVGLLYEYLAHHDPVTPRPVENHEKILRRALTLIRDHPDRSFTLDELARNTYASKRCIQYAFSRLLGITPMRFLKLYRLNSLRRDLAHSSDFTSLSSLLARHAFTNAGRTAAEYQELFGEYPRDTAARRRREASPRFTFGS